MVTEDAVLSTASNDVMANLIFRQDFPAFMFDELYSSDEEISTSEAMETISPRPEPSTTLEEPVAQTSNHPSQSPLSDDMNSIYFNMKNLKEYILSNGDAIIFKEAGLKVWEVVMVILGISTRFHLSYKGRRALIEATKLSAESWKRQQQKISLRTI